MTLHVNNEKIEDEVIKAEAERLAPQYEQLVAKLDTEDSKQHVSLQNVSETLKRNALSHGFSPCKTYELTPNLATGRSPENWHIRVGDGH